MNAEELAERFNMAEHPENGAFLERHYESSEARAASGSIYYYVAPGEKTKFHKIDCDEYWCYTEGADLEVWMIDEETGAVSVSSIGTGESAVPFVYVRKGTIFASRHAGASEGTAETASAGASSGSESGTSEGTFLVCITVPRFTYEGFTLIEDDEIKSRFPDAVSFFGN